MPGKGKFCSLRAGVFALLSRRSRQRVFADPSLLAALLLRGFAPRRVLKARGFAPRRVIHRRGFAPRSVWLAGGLGLLLECIKLFKQGKIIEMRSRFPCPVGVILPLY